jgi:poly(hydroxyalkanoate) depolymerase family esterase
MFENFQTWCRNCISNTTSRIARLLRRKKPLPRGKWLSGQHRSSSGLLVYAPMISPERDYRLYFPVDYRQDERLPLLVMLHGCKQNPESFAAGTRVNLFADRGRFLVVYPEQRRLANPYRCWNWFDPSSNHASGEVAIIVGMVRAIANENNVDRSRIYVAGISAGGALASALASCHAELFAACAVHSGLMFQAASSPTSALSVMQHGSDRDPETAGEAALDLSHKKSMARPVLVIHGDADDTVHPVNGEQIVAQFLSMNKRARVGDGSHDGARHKQHSNGSGYDYEIVDHGPERAPLIRYITVKGMGHAWSGGSSRFPYNDPRGPDASAMMMEFFALHRRETTH